MADYKDDDLDEQESDLTEEEIAEADEAEDEEIRAEKEAGKKVVLNEFKRMKAKYMAKSVIWPFLNSEEKNLANKVKKIKYNEYVSFMKLVEQKKNEFAHKVNSALSAIVPLLPIILIGLLVIIAIVVFISTIMPWLVGDAEEAGGMSSPAGVNGDSFYGVRTIYRDGEQAKADLLFDYAGALNYTITDFNNNNTDIKLEISLPVDENDKLDITKLQNDEFKDELNLVKEVAKVVYLADNSNLENVETTVQNLTLDELLLGIKYFGFDAGFVYDISNVWAGYINENSLYTQTGGEIVDIKDYLTTEFEILLIDEYIKEDEPNRTEMLYVKDYILSGDESYVENIPQKDYVAYIFMAKTNVKVSKFSFLVRGVETDNFNIYLMCNDTVYDGFDCDVFASAQEFDTDYDTYSYELETTINLSAFTDINTNALADGISLYQILHGKQLNSDYYLQTVTDDNDNQYFTFKQNKNTAIVRFEFNEPFYMAEYETEYASRPI